MDGNGRWAKRRGLPRTLGHHAGVNALKRTVEAAPGMGVEWLTVFGFSTENWRRPAGEVSELMRQRAITSVCERGIDAHQGQYQLSFFYRNRRARLRVDTSGRILQRSTTHIAQRPPGR